MKRVYLSPHLDDAVLSCGGAIHRQAAAGDAVQVVTLFAEDAQTGASLSPFALEQHAYWGDVPRPMAVRRGEDRAALARLGAVAEYLAYLDAVYRVDADGRWMHVDLAGLFGEVRRSDPLAEAGTAAMAERLAALIPAEEGLVVYAPLGVGGHVDHRITHAAARDLLARGYRLAFYEDYPYAEKAGAVEAAVAAAGAGGWTVEAIGLDAADVSAKVMALGYYRSQMRVLFGGAEAMPNRVWTFAGTRGAGTCLAERIWWP